MKTIEEIESLDMTSLDRIASNEGVEVPDSLKRKLMETSRTLELMDSYRESSRKEKRRQGIMWSMASASVAAAAVVAILLSTGSPEPEDTFQDPALAYEQLEMTFNYIGKKMNTGAQMAYSAQPILDNAINKVLK